MIDEQTYSLRNRAVYSVAVASGLVGWKFRRALRVVFE
jgi:hypothetical protein